MTASSNSTTSYENLNENKTISELQDSKLNIQQEIVEDADMVPRNSTTETNDNQIQIHATTTRISTTTVSDLAENSTHDKTSDTHTMTTKAGGNGYQLSIKQFPSLLIPFTTFRSCLARMKQTQAQQQQSVLIAILLIITQRQRMKTLQLLLKCPQPIIFPNQLLLHQLIRLPSYLIITNLHSTLPFRNSMRKSPLD